MTLSLLRLQKKTIDIPLLFIGATKDAALPIALSAGMEDLCPAMTRKEVETSHWALWEAPAQINEMIKTWIEGHERSKSSL